MKVRKKSRVKEMKLKCPFCKEDMIFTEDDWTNSQIMAGKYHNVRRLIFEHALDHIEESPWGNSNCRGGSIEYYFIESQNNSEYEAMVCPSCGETDFEWKEIKFVCKHCKYEGKYEDD